MSETSTKKWYQSKLVLLGLSVLFVFGGALLLRFLGNQGVTTEQMAVLQEQYPQIAESIKQIQSGQDIWQSLGALAGALVVIIRVWFTQKVLPQSMPKLPQ